MHNNNTMDKTDYITGHIVWGLLSMFWFKQILFRSIYGQAFTASRLALWGLVLVSVSIGILITFKRRRNYVSMMVNLLIPYEIYTVIAYHRDIPALSIVVLTITLALSACYFVLVMTPEIKNRERKGRILQRRTKFGLLGVRTISAFCLMAIIIPLGINSVFGNKLLFNKVTAEVPSEISEWTVSNNIGTISNLRQEVWETLSLFQKSDILQTVCNIEANDLGLPHKLSLIIGTISSESTLAQYDDNRKTVTVNIDYLDKTEAEEILNAVCHEACHAYQHRLVDLYDSVSDEYKDMLVLAAAAVYKAEFASYRDGDDDVFGYYFQICELNAREYAANATRKYYDIINEVLIEAES